MLNRGICHNPKLPCARVSRSQHSHLPTEKICWRVYTLWNWLPHLCVKLPRRSEISVPCFLSAWWTSPPGGSTSLSNSSCLRLNWPPLPPNPTFSSVWSYHHCYCQALMYVRFFSQPVNKMSNSDTNFLYPFTDLLNTLNYIHAPLRFRTLSVRMCDNPVRCEDDEVRRHRCEPPFSHWRAFYLQWVIPKP